MSTQVDSPSTPIGPVPPRSGGQPATGSERTTEGGAHHGAPPTSERDQLARRALEVVTDLRTLWEPNGEFLYDDVDQVAALLEVLEIPRRVMEICEHEALLLKGEPL